MSALVLSFTRILVAIASASIIPPASAAGVLLNNTREPLLCSVDGVNRSTRETRMLLFAAVPARQTRTFPTDLWPSDEPGDSARFEAIRLSCRIDQPQRPAERFAAEFDRDAPLWFSEANAMSLMPASNMFHQFRLDPVRGADGEVDGLQVLLLVGMLDDDGALRDSTLDADFPPGLMPRVPA